MHRLFRLDGETSDLQDLADLCSAGARMIVRHDEHYYLSVEMQDGVDGEQALTLAEDELATINGLALAWVRSYRAVRVSGVSKVDPDTGKISTSAYAKGSSNSRSRMRAVGVAIGPDDKAMGHPPVSSESPGQTILDLASKNDALQRALFLYGKLDHTWRGLYMVLEAIEDGNGDEKGLVKKPWGGSRVKDFKATCNSPKAIGAEARHASTKQGVDAQKLTLPEARKLIRQLLGEWLEELRSPKP